MPKKTKKPAKRYTLKDRSIESALVIFLTSGIAVIHPSKDEGGGFHAEFYETTGDSEELR